MKMKMKDCVLYIVLIFLTPLFQCSEVFHNQVFDIVGGGNYTYYWIPHPGTVMIYLNTMEGDADLYVSSKNMKPTFDIENHELQSTSCGTEQIMVPSTYNRPLAVAVYGHPSHSVSKYTLDVIISNSVSKVDDYPSDNHDEYLKMPYDTSTKTMLPHKHSDESEFEERSVLWTLFLRFLQILFDVLID